MSEFDQFETIYVTLTETGVCTLTLNRPQVHNAFDELMIGELTNALEQLEKHQSVRILLVRGTGKSFSAGADLKWMQRMAEYSEEQNFEDARRLATMMDKLYRFQNLQLRLFMEACTAVQLAWWHAAISPSQRTQQFSVFLKLKLASFQL